MPDLPEKRGDPRDRPLPTARDAIRPVPRKVALPAARNRDRLAAAAREIKETGASLEQAAKSHDLDPEQLHRWLQGARKRQQISVDAGDGDPRSTRMRPSAEMQPRESSPTTPTVPAPSADKLEENWQRAAEAAEELREPGGLEQFLNKAPFLRPFLGSDRRRAATGVIGGLLLACIIFAVTSARQPAAQPPSRAATEPAATTETAPTLPDLDAREAAEAYALEFFRADGLDEKLRYVSNPETVRPLAVEFYARPENSRLVQASPDATAPRSVGILIGECPFVIVEVEAGDTYHATPVEILADGEMQIDWETAVLYSVMPWPDFVEQRPTDAFPFRVRCEPAQYFNPPYENDKLYRSFRLTPPREDGEILYGFLRYDAPLTPYLYSLLSSRGGFGNLILEIRFPEVGFRNCVEIVSVVSEGWLNPRARGEEIKTPSGTP